jgi:hypothetical protein
MHSIAALSETKPLFSKDPIGSWIRGANNEHLMWKLCHGKAGNERGWRLPDKDVGAA